MTPPSDNIQFFESKDFIKATRPAPALRLQVLEYLKSWPSKGLEFAKGVREVSPEFNGTKFTVIYKRRGNTIGIMHIYQLPIQAAQLEATKKDIITVHGKI